MTPSPIPARNPQASIPTFNPDPSSRDASDVNRAGRGAGWHSSRTPPKLTVCSADPWNATESGTVVMWLNMALSTVRRLRAMDRADIELWLRSRVANKALAELFASAERMLPEAPYEDVLICARDGIM